jgi:hypothetical protein
MTGRAMTETTQARLILKRAKGLVECSGHELEPEGAIRALIVALDQQNVAGSKGVA